MPGRWCKDHKPKRNKIYLLPLSAITIKILESMKEPCNRVYPAAVEVSRIYVTLVWPLSKCNHTKTTTAALPKFWKDPDITNQTI